MRPTRYLLLALVALLTLTACLREGDVKVTLPTDPPQLVVESYLEPDSVYRVSVSETVPYFTLPQSLPIVSNALVTITYLGQTDTLTFYPLGSPGNFYPFGEYRLNKIIPRDYLNKFYLRVEHPDGRVATAETPILEPVFIDTLFCRFEPDNQASIQIEFLDRRPGQLDFHRIVFDNGKADSLWHGFFSDRLSTGSRLIWATDFDFDPGDTVAVRLYRCTQDYYDYYRTVRAAISGNQSPFAEPSLIISNIKGGFGIFTGLSQDRQLYVVPQP